jgi:hypothetical protein
MAAPDVKIFFIADESADGRSPAPAMCTQLSDEHESSNDDPEIRHITWSCKHMDLIEPEHNEIWDTAIPSN